MRHRYFRFSLLLGLAFFAVGSFAAEPTPPDTAAALPALTVDDKLRRIFSMLNAIFDNAHYHSPPRAVVETRTFNDYFNALDPERVLFLQSEVEDYRQKFQGRMPLSGDDALNVPFAIYKLYRERAYALDTWSIARLKQPLKLNGQQHLDNPRPEIARQQPWRKSMAAIHAQQEKILKDQIISEMLADDESEADAVKTLITRYRNQAKRLRQVTANDVFELYSNIFTQAFDPHSNYLSPAMVDDFDIQMTLSLEGIGATLSMRDDHVIVRSLVPGGPAAKSGKLGIGSKILAVGQGDTGKMVDVVGWALPKVIKLIRGKKGSVVRLLVAPAHGGKNRVVTLVRDHISLKDQGATAKVETVQQHGKTLRLGVIRLPGFYMDYARAQEGDDNYRSTSHDMKKLLEELKAQQVDGILVDLRANGGGSLYAVIDTLGLFVGRGPVVSVVSATHQETDESGQDAVYSGPLAVLIDRHSASASEIFAAAIQDYGRGIIIGENSYGKGTVQGLIDLNRFPHRPGEHLGQVKMTSAMFYRINGASTQERGVVPDVALPETSLPDDGEINAPHHIAWQTIAPASAKVQIIPKTWLQTLNAQHRQRLQTLPALQTYAHYLKIRRARILAPQRSLNLAERRAQFAQDEQLRDTYEREEGQQIPPLASDAQRRKEIEDYNRSVERKGDKDHFVPDVALFEALNILFDYIELMRAEVPKAA